MQIVDTDSSCNMVHAEHITLDHYVQGEAGHNELTQKVRQEADEVVLHKR